jgi:DNA-binding NtrC family response regulator
MPETSAKQTVLVVEDEALIRFSIADEIRDAGFEVLEAANADVAIDLLESHPGITILFTDIDMPGSMDGLKLSEAVRRRWPPVQIIVTSGHIKINAENLPVAGHFFSKPYSSTKLISTMLSISGTDNSPR